MNNDGQIAGRSTEVVLEIMKRLEVDYPIYLEPWAEETRDLIQNRYMPYVHSWV